jgi:thiosulfate/3-mercaptopyruvate sulfurtransferase
MKLSPIISLQELLNLINHPKIRIIDASATTNAAEQFAKEHVKGALFFDLETDLSSIEKDFKNGGRHPLPDSKDFLQRLYEKQIRPENHIVIYDRFNGALAAARLWWMLRSMNYENVQVLDGGFNSTKNTGICIESSMQRSLKGGAITKPDSLQEKNWSLPTVGREFIKKIAKDPDFLLIDVRAPKRYHGIDEPIDPIAGHIPNAINLPFQDNLDEHGHFLSPEKLTEKYAPLVAKHGSKNIIVYCGSGVTACHTLLAFDLAGLEIPNLYVGSYGEWCRNR